MRIKSSAAGVVLMLTLAGAGPVAAQGWEMPRVGGEAWSAAGCEGGPLLVVAQFLSLAPEQVQALSGLLQERQGTLAPILQAIAEHEQQISLLITSEGVQAGFLTGFESLLGDEQRERWQQVRVAAALQPVLPAFQALQAL